MKKIHLVYDECYEDADILCVPDWVCEQAVSLPGRYSKWLHEQGRNDMETEGFIEWLNAHITSDAEKVLLLAQHVSVSENEPSISF